MAFNIAKSFALLPYNAHLEDYMHDDNEFWRQQYLAQTGGDSSDLDQFGYPLHCD